MPPMQVLTQLLRQQPYTPLSSDVSAGPVLVTASGLQWGQIAPG